MSAIRQQSKIDDLNQQVSDKQQELERLRPVCGMQAAQGGSEANPRSRILAIQSLNQFHVSAG